MSNSNPWNLTRLDAALVKKQPWGGFAMATISFGDVALARTGRPVFHAVGCDNLRNAVVE